MKKEIMIEPELIGKAIHMIRGRKIMLDSELARLYGVKTKILVQAVKRNKNRFPLDFMFQLTWMEYEPLRSQIVTSKPGRGGRRYLPYAFTEHGVAMLSSVLSSERAIQVNIEIMRAFSRLREMLQGHKELRKKIEEMEAKYDGQFRIVFETLKELFDPPIDKESKKIGFHKQQ